MATVKAVHSVCTSIVRYLSNAYPLAGDFPCQFRVLSSGEINGDSAVLENSLSLFLYRVTVNEHLRGQTLVRQSGEEAPPLSIELHFLITVWSKSAAFEQTICAWVMQQLHHHPILDRSSLGPEGGWNSEDLIQIIPAELSNEDLMRIWDALAPDYRLSLSYIARVVRIEPPEQESGRPVVAARLHLQEKKGGGA